MRKRIEHTILFFLALLFVFPGSQLKAQHLEYARSIINELCSKEYYGRAYANGGDKKAAKYIKKQLKQWGAKPVGGTYAQAFHLQANTFPEVCSIKINDSALIPGKDYLVASSSPTLQGKFSVEPYSFYNSNAASPKSKGNFFLVDTLGKHIKGFGDYKKSFLYSQHSNAKGYIEITDNIVPYYPSPDVANVPYIYLVRSSIKDSVQSIEVNIENKYQSNYTTRNIIGMLPGQTDSTIVFSAHYEHVGCMGKETWFPGAHDNASGVAMALALCKKLSMLQKRHYTFVFLFFSGEEIGLRGSRYFTEHPLLDLSKIKFLVNIDLVGSGEEGITVVNGTEFTSSFELLQEINKEHHYLTDIAPRAPAANSDHYFFHVKGVPCFFIYTRGKYKEYHNIFDMAENVPLNEFDDLTELLFEFSQRF